MKKKCKFENGEDDDDSSSEDEMNNEKVTTKYNRTLMFQNRNRRLLNNSEVDADINENSQSIPEQRALFSVDSSQNVLNDENVGNNNNNGDLIHNQRQPPSAERSIKKKYKKQNKGQLLIKQQLTM